MPKVKEITAEACCTARFNPVSKPFLLPSEHRCDQLDHFLRHRIERASCKSEHAGQKYCHRLERGSHISNHQWDIPSWLAGNRCGDALGFQIHSVNNLRGWPINIMQYSFLGILLQRLSCIRLILFRYWPDELYQLALRFA